MKKLLLPFLLLLSLSAHPQQLVDSITKGHKHFLTMAPNPVTYTINIIGIGYKQINMVLIIDHYGKVVYQSNRNTNIIDITWLKLNYNQPYYCVVYYLKSNRKDVIPFYRIIPNW